MQVVDIVTQVDVKTTPRLLQASTAFDMPLAASLERRWAFEVGFDERPWNVGLIVGPSGAGKSLCASHLFGVERVRRTVAWRDDVSVLDDFDARLTMDDIVAACSAVGFNTIPSWCKPYRVLSNGEQFRVTLARRLTEDADPIVVDEFTSVVDRQVARIAAHAVAKWARQHERRFVAVTCHEDVEDWLNPDWVIRPDLGRFDWRLLRRRPNVEARVERVDYAAWRLFAPYHYMSADLNTAARCYCLFVGRTPVAFAGVMNRPVSRVAVTRRPTRVWGLSRLVTLPDWQGMGFAFALIRALGSALAALGDRFRTYPAHPALVRSFERSQDWACIKRYGAFTRSRGASSTIAVGIVGRHNGVYEYTGPMLADVAHARALLEGLPEAAHA